MNVQIVPARSCKPPFVLIERIDGSRITARNITAVASGKHTSTIMYDIGPDVGDRRDIVFSSDDLLLIAKEDD